MHNPTHGVLLVCQQDASWGIRKPLVTFPNCPAWYPKHTHTLGMLYQPWEGGQEWASWEFGNYARWARITYPIQATGYRLHARQARCKTRVCCTIGMVIHDPFVRLRSTVLASYCSRSTLTGPRNTVSSRLGRRSLEEGWKERRAAQVADGWQLPPLEGTRS